ncbi:MAG: preprotein translocase subunit SecE [Bdellovibrionales bacterium]
MTNENQVDEKPKRTLVDFAHETQREISKVTWPTRNEITMTTILIVIFALITGVFFLVVDSGLGFVISKLLGMS